MLRCERRQHTWLSDVEAQEAEGSSQGAVWRHAVDRPGQHPQPRVGTNVKHHAAGAKYKKCIYTLAHGNALVRSCSSRVVMAGIHQCGPCVLHTCLHSCSDVAFAAQSRVLYTRRVLEAPSHYTAIAGSAA